MRTTTEIQLQCPAVEDDEELTRHKSGDKGVGRHAGHRKYMDRGPEEGKGMVLPKDLQEKGQ